MISPADSADATSPTGRTASAWRRAGEARDVDGAVSCLAQDVQIISPLTARFRFRGREQAREMLTAGFEVIDAIHYHTELGDDCARAMFYYGRCGREQFEEAQLLRFDDRGQIVELTLFGRPLPGVTAVMAAIGPRMLHNWKQPALARLIRAATSPLAVLTRLGEQHLVPLADPDRSPADRTRERA